MGYRIKTVSERTGIPRGTLLAWERRYGLLHPDRQDNGYREYSEAEVDLLCAVKRLVDQGHKVSEAISLVGLRPPPTGDGLVLALVGELARFQRAGADRLARQWGPRGQVRLVTELYRPLLREVEAQEAAGVLTAAQARFAVAFCREQLVALLMGLDNGPRGGPRALVVGPPGLGHDADLLGLAVLLASHGWRVSWLGLAGGLPEVLALVQSLPPRLVCVGSQPVRDPVALATFCATLQDRAPAGVRVVVGAAGLEAALEPLGEQIWSH